MGSLWLKQIQLAVRKISQKEYASHLCKELSAIAKEHLLSSMSQPTTSTMMLSKVSLPSLILLKSNRLRLNKKRNQLTLLVSTKKNRSQEKGLNFYSKKRLKLNWPNRI